jgi:hypothetical protein
MTSLFTHTPYAEDQPNSHAILYLHVMRASAMSFTFISLFQFPISVIRARRSATPIPTSTLVASTLKISGRSLIVGTLAGVAMTWGRMRGREEIEWQDRSWRILENKGEVHTDWMSLGGASAGAVVGLAAARRGRIPGTVSNAALGGAGVGMASGIPFMIGTYASGRKPA